MTFPFFFLRRAFVWILILGQFMLIKNLKVKTCPFTPKFISELRSINILKKRFIPLPFVCATWPIESKPIPRGWFKAISICQNFKRKSAHAGKTTYIDADIWTFGFHKKTEEFWGCSACPPRPFLPGKEPQPSPKFDFFITGEHPRFDDALFWYNSHTFQVVSPTYINETCIGPINSTSIQKQTFWQERNWSWFFMAAFWWKLTGRNLFEAFTLCYFFQKRYWRIFTILLLGLFVYEGIGDAAIFVFTFVRSAIYIAPIGHLFNFFFATLWCRYRHQYCANFTNGSVSADVAQAIFSFHDDNFFQSPDASDVVMKWVGRKPAFFLASIFSLSYGFNLSECDSLFVHAIIAICSLAFYFVKNL